MKRHDIHIHTEATSPYLKGDANLLPYYAQGQKNSLDFMAITDHFHYFWQNTQYVINQRKFLDHMSFLNPRVYLGVEQTILSESGRIGIRNSGLNELDFIILSIHWMSIGGRLHVSEIEKVKKNPPKYAKFIQMAKNYYQNVIDNPKIRNIPKILGHPWHFLIDHLNTPIVSIIDGFEFVCKICAQNNIALEINLGSIPKDLDLNQKSIMLELWQDLFSLFREYKPMIAFATDSHQLKNIGQIDPILQLIQKFGLNDQNSISESFFE
jgi:histidinol phosphatase-like PHP family hydrolase